MEKGSELIFTHQVVRLRDHSGHWQKTGESGREGARSRVLPTGHLSEGKRKEKTPETLLCWKRTSGVESHPHQRPLRKMEMRMDLFFNSTVGLGHTRA